ncbi:MAG: hypothetical protein C0429_09925 [Sphingopyxis sp.]|nr:hypothetical protein [Sphingopyxis sp.]
MTLVLQGLLSTSEIRKLIAKLIFAAQRHPTFIWAWSRWRQAHQTIAALCHRKIRLETQL